MGKNFKPSSIWGWLSFILVTIYLVFGELFNVLGIYSQLFNDEETEKMVMDFFSNKILLIIAVILNGIFLKIWFKELTKYGKFPPNLEFTDISKYLHKKGYSYNKMDVINEIMYSAENGNLVVWVKECVNDREFRRLSKDEVRDLVFEDRKLINIGGECFHKPTISKKELRYYFKRNLFKKC